MKIAHPIKISKLFFLFSFALYSCPIQDPKKMRPRTNIEKRLSKFKPSKRPKGIAKANRNINLWVNNCRKVFMNTCKLKI